MPLPIWIILLFYDLGGFYSLSYYAWESNTLKNRLLSTMNECQTQMFEKALKRNLNNVMAPQKSTLKRKIHLGIIYVSSSL